MRKAIPFLIVLVLVLFLAPIAVLAVGEIISPTGLLPDAGMGETGFISLLLQSMDPLAVVIAIALTQLAKIFMPSPIFGDRSTQTIPGSAWNRILPVLPLIFGLSTVLLAHWGQPFRQSLVQGIVSGIAAAYFYRTWKVTVFGG